MEAYMPSAAMLATQCIYSTVALWAKAVFTGGMSPMIFVVYRQAVATIVLVPIVAVVHRATLNLSMYYQGVHLASSSLATAMSNLIPATTFVMAASVGLERVAVRQPRSLAKIFGTIVCVGGAMIMAFLRGPKLLSDMNIILHSTTGSAWVMGALFLFGSSSCWALWLILQVPICKWYMDPLTLSAWMCLLSTLQTAALVPFLLPDTSAWKIPSLFELSCCIFAVRTELARPASCAIATWDPCRRCRVRRDILPAVVVHLGAGPALYSATFSPLATVITTAFSAVILGEDLRVGSLLGAIAVVTGLYVVLWGKAGDIKSGTAPDNLDDLEATVATLRSDEHLDDGDGVAEPLLAGGDPAEKSTR
ncbi:hypothetical protein EJB05_43090 [Eragrostis curvula]|uniref:WAT1-related protein n=1 Tax=Eragrostis curvula TaxID=38414 RepID=A0A5J9TDZ2_9POAL|nr:hypothetical protein EJB05_43090 [Eragrostis curvula]